MVVLIPKTVVNDDVMVALISDMMIGDCLLMMECEWHCC